MKSRKVRRNKCVIAIRLRSFDVQVAIRISVVSSDRKPWLKWFCIIRIFIIYHNRKFRDKSDCVLCLLAQSCLTLCDLMDCSPSASSVHGILQARILEMVAMPSSK